MNSLRFIRRRRELRALRICPLGVVVAFGLAGCDDPSADLQTRLTYAQKELDVANTEIQRLRAEADRPREQTAEEKVVRPAVTDEGFREAAKIFAGELEGAIKGATVSAPSYSEANTVATYYFTLTMADGSKSVREVVASTTRDGRWKFPTAEQFARTLLAAAPDPQPPKPVSPAPSEPRQTIDPLGGGPKPVVEIDFGDKPRAPIPQRNQGAMPPPAIRQVPPRPPSPNLPRADEEKAISFERKQ